MKKVLIITVLLTLTFSPIALGSFGGNWKSTLTLEPANGPQTSSITGFSSKLQLNYASSGLSFSSTSTFNLDNFTRQAFELGLEPGLLDVDSTISFDPPDNRLDYWSFTGDMVIAGLGIKNTFLLEYMDDISGYGAGNKLELSGEISEDVTVKISNYFGMEEDLVEQEGWQQGSGYDISTYGPNGESVSMLEYESTTAEIVGQQFDCCKFDLTSQFSADDGFDYASFDFQINNEDLPLLLDTRMTFTPDKKRVSLTPQFDISWNCLSVYTGFKPGTIDGSNNKIEEFQIKGFGLNRTKIGEVYVSSLMALGDGVLWKSKTAGSDIYLRAGDYVLDPDPIQEVFYKEVRYAYDKESFSSILSLETSNVVDFGIDFYGKKDTNGNLFNIGLVTGELEHSFTRQFSLGLGTSVYPNAGVNRIDLIVDYSF
mgnify:CR=1 FL=1